MRRAHRAGAWWSRLLHSEHGGSRGTEVVGVATSSSLCGFGTTRLIPLVLLEKVQYLLVQHVLIIVCNSLCLPISHVCQTLQVWCVC